MPAAKSQVRKGGRPLAAETERLSTAILAAAEDVFLAEGFSSARIEAIAAAAGTSKQTIYARFGSKEMLFVAVSDRLLRERFAAQPAPAASLREKLLALAKQMLDGMLDPKMVRMSAIITAEAHRFPDLARAADADDVFPGRPLILAALKNAAARGEIKCADPVRAMLMFQDMVLAAPLRAAALGLDRFDKPALRAWARAAVDLFLDGARPR